VYSTEQGRTCPECRQPVAACSCKQAAKPAGDGIVRVSRDTKSRGGKCVTVIKGALLEAAELTALAKRLKLACGTGGTCKDGVIEIQGDHCELVLTKLKAEGFTVKKAGG
jgi:translation initiation factor 1